jgi:beta-1,2-mannobiose phosphorylase / 1,2-beta-oligomannan phosphorylase
MIKIKREGIILRPTPQPFENKSVFNPTTYKQGQHVHMIYRAINDEFVSSLGYAKLKGPLEVVERWEKPFLSPKYNYEKRGMEDPRLVKIGDTFYLVYIAHDGKNALLAYFYGDDLFKLKRGGVISPTLSYRKVGKLLRSAGVKDDYFFFESFYRNYSGQDVLVWDKDGFFFPKKINGKFAFVHRILPDIHIAYADELDDYKKNSYWTEYFKNLKEYVLIEQQYGFEKRHIGGGCPPIMTDHGWLMIFHGTEEQNEGRIYHGAAALLDKKDPQRVIARLPYPLFSPTEEFEKSGHVTDVVFPTGTAIFGERLYIYYGAADSHIAVGSVELEKLLKELLKHKVEL